MPLSARYDPHEWVHGEPFPHLFARRIGTRQEVISYAVVRQLLNELAHDADLTDAGQPIRFTPHNFRRLFSTETSGPPLHIAATLLGHLNLDTTRGYTAVFPEEDDRRAPVLHRAPPHAAAVRRDAAGLRRGMGRIRAALPAPKVALGNCHRPYRTPRAAGPPPAPCVHEHARSRRRFLRVDPAQLPRIQEMTCNAEARLAEAKNRAWLGEVAALEESLKQLRQRHVEAENQLSIGIDLLS
ncbi:tyrosine-type recombinase/integrase [Kribbella solani]|uniref:tyrosine-type recombinase/integrase n=1 Tax=Kribbella solani TaxID=236067 RepID=UPI0029B4EA9D|nr:tyrosine-type recombinase/integrase [Kribbella solani]MDX2968610.1 tyrosine-type recombinase/integrase [Kribbella solani]